MRFIRKNHPIEQPVSAVLGNLDGLHIAHRKLIECCINNAQTHGRQSAVLTFMPHPREYFFGIGPERILPYDIKDRVMEKMGVDYLVILDFDEAIATMDPETFVRTVLMERLNVRHVAVGFNYRFGRSQMGDAELLRSLGQRLGLTVDIQGEIQTGGERVSSTAIRKYINAGQVDRAGALLGYYPMLQGIVEEGEKVGTEIGFPTANIVLRENLLAPMGGVYTGWVKTRTGVHRAIVNIGVKPTLGDHFSRNIEAHLIGFQGNLYGEKIDIAFTKRLRDEIKFSGLDLLQSQLEKDRAVSLALVRTEPPDIAQFPDDLYF